MIRRLRYIGFMMALLLMVGGHSPAWAAYTVKYHILTLPMTADRPGNTKSEYYTWRMEALRVIVDNQTTLQPLPTHFQSPLAENFKYYASGKVTQLAGGSKQIYENHSQNKYYLYKINGEDTVTDEDDVSPMSIGDAITSDCDIYVTYDYNASNNVAKLDGTEKYNIIISGGFLAYNKGRNNRLAVIPEKYNDEDIVSGEQLCSDEFVKVDLSGKNTGISTWWNGNQTPRATAESYFHFLFKYVGCDPYNITIMTAYEGNDCYYEKYNQESVEHKKYYKWATIFTTAKLTNDNLLISSADNREYTTRYDSSDPVAYTDKPGYYHGVGGHIWNSFAILNNSDNSGYVYVGTRCVDASGNIGNPSGNKYNYLKAENNALTFSLMNVATASTYSSDKEMYETHTYTFKVKTPYGTIISVDKDWSDAYDSYAIMDHIPDGIKRKYVSFDGAYKTDDFDDIANNTLTTFEDANTSATVEGGKIVIWLKYTSSMPFDALPLDGNYVNARWYTLRMDGDVFDKYLAYDESDNLVTTNGSGATKGSDSDVHQGEADGTVTQVAFMGDPFELKILAHAASDGASANRYIGCATGATANTGLNTNKTGSSDISTWEIVDKDGDMVLREYGSYADPMYIGMGSAANNKPVIYSSTASRIKVVALSQKEYVYHIYNMANNIAVKASITQDIGKHLTLACIPEVIRSPFLALPGVSLKYYYSEEDALYNEGAGQNEQTHAPFDAPTHKDIYVRYIGMEAALADTRYNHVLFNNTQEFNVMLNEQYLSYNSDGNESDGYINSKYPITDGEANSEIYVWKLLGGDPYAMQVINMAGSLSTSNYVHASQTNNSFITFGSSDGAAKFVVKSSNATNTFEVMLATGDDLDASTKYYNIGRSESNRVKILDNVTAPHLNSQLRFQLTLRGSTAKYYNLIDKAGNKLLRVRTRDDHLVFPANYWSPLVLSYHYYLETDFVITNGPDGIADTADDIYTLREDAVELTTIGENTEIYVIYTTNNLVNLKRGVLYLLKFNRGDSFRQEDGHDDLTADPVQAVYPYCNGDCNFFVYGQDEYDLQQEGAASTRTRWAWYLESANNDPYHVKICSRQLETFNNNDRQAYFRTCAVNYQQDADGAAPHIITTLAWPDITGEQGTEYMVLGSVGMYQLLTTETIPIDLNSDGDYEDENESNERHVVKSFEQYWKTYDTVKNKLLTKAKDPEDPSKSLLDDEDKGANPTGATTVEKAKYRTLLTTAPTSGYGFHSYPHWAYAKRFNGYNANGETKKGWEEIEHWYQTVNMGEGYFDFVETTVDPALILLDQHGWEIMRKPLPSSPDDPDKEDKYKAIKVYDSPMVKEYIFWSSASKRTGLHQYYKLDKRVGGDFTSTTLTNLPPYGSTNVKDAKGNLNDQYVTYIVKDEYASSYTWDEGTGEWVASVFLIQQGDKFASNDESATIQGNAVPASGMRQYIIDNISNLTTSGSKKNELWYVKPNANIDNEQGYAKVAHNWGSNPNAYEQAAYEHEKTAKIINDNTLGKFSFSNGFDPYNIQIQSVSDDDYIVSNATGANLEDGAWAGVYSETPGVSLGTQKEVSATWYDNAGMTITDATYMAVQDANGNMQLMPRFDHTRRIRDFSTLETPVGEASKLNEMKTKLYRPLTYVYHIIDNDGNESLRYKSGGDLIPQTPEHFKSPIAKDFKYYKTLSAGVVSDEITESFAGAELTSSSNDVYIRYTYNADADEHHALKGKWLTMQLNTLDAIYNSGIKRGTSKPDPVNGDDREWQWKFLKTPQSDPDPYAVSLYNRSVEGVEQPATDTRYALLSHTSGGYALAEAGLGTALEYDYTYKFLNGDGLMSSSVAATTAVESGFTGTVASFSGTNSQVKLLDDVEHTFTYHVYTNGTNGNNEVKYGIEAISEQQTFTDVSTNEFVPKLPDAARTRLLNEDDYLYYEHIVDMGNSSMELANLYGLYEDDVYVRYKAYNADYSPYKVPNVMGQEDGHIAPGTGSNDAGLGLDGKLLYNIAWYNDQMMKNNLAGTGTESTACSSLIPAWTPTATTEYEWHFDGSDPYAIKIKSVGASGKYIHKDAESMTCGLDASATTFMILDKEGYDYGVLAKTGDKAKMLTFGDHDSDGATPSTTYLTTGNPTKFIFYALATHKVIYHLVIAKTCKDHISPNTGEYVEIPWWNGTTLTTKTIYGSTQRDLTSQVSGIPGDKYQLGSTINGQTYSYDAGHISLGDMLEVPSAFFRPNVVYTFFVEGVYSDDACNSPVSEMNNLYKGHEVTNMGDNSGLLNTTVLINIVYTFNGNLETNTGEGFVVDPSGTQWYTFETSGATPYLSQFTNAMGGFEVKEGRATHYTNDFLWSPLGDPYGFRMYNRYVYKNSWNGTSNSGETNRVMTTIDNSAVDPEDGPFVEGKAVTMSPDNSEAPEDDPNNVYELLPGSVDGYFFVHPVANNSGTQYYLRTVAGDGIINMKLSNYPTNLKFGLTEDLVKPYFDLVGYVGGLKEIVANSVNYGDNHINVKAIATALKNGTSLTGAQLIDAQKVIYDATSIQPFTTGYYRMHSLEGLSEIDGIRYASGHTHKIEESAGVPMHFYGREGISTQFNLLKSKDGERVNEGFTSSVATRGDIPIPAVEYDPSSIFYITGTYDNAKISTQELYIKGELGRTEDDGSNTATIEAEGVRAKALMTSAVGSASELWIMDIGGGVMLIHDRTIPKYRKYLSYDQTEAAHIYDLKLTHHTHTDYAKWCLQPANNLGLRITTHSGGDVGTYGGDAYYYSTFYAPFDIKIEETTSGKYYRAFICDTKISPWNGTELHPRPISWYNIEENSCPADYRGDVTFVPAGTPVIVETTDNSGYIKATIPTTTPSDSYSTTAFKVKIGGTDLDATGRTNTLTGQYLEQKLDAGDKGYVYVFGLPYTGTFSESSYLSNGDIGAILPSPTNSGWGFYKNINPNKEADPVRASWTRNNWYVLGNRVYYRAAGVGGGAPDMRDVQFVPVIFGDDEGEEEEQPEETQPQPTRVGDGCVYDILGRKVASAEEVKAGTWYRHLSPGVYIVNGQKVFVGVGRM